MMTIKDVEVKKALNAWKPDAMLTNLSIAYYEEPQFSARRLFPICPVTLPAGKFYIFRKGDLARDNMRKKPPYGTVAPAVFGLDTQSYTCEIYQEKIGMDRLIALPYERASAFDMKRARTKTLTEQIALHQEIEFAEKFFKAGVWNNEWQGAASTNKANKKFAKFSGANDPAEIMDYLSMEIRRNGRRRPNKLALGTETYAALRSNAAIKERIKYTGTNSAPAVVNEQCLAAIFGVDSVVVLDSTVNRAGVGAADQMEFVCDPKGALLLYTPEAAAVDTPSAGYMFTYQISGGDYIAVEEFEGEPGSYTTFLSGLIAYDMRITSQDLAVYLTDCV